MDIYVGLDEHMVLDSPILNFSNCLLLSLAYMYRVCTIDCTIKLGRSNARGVTDVRSTYAEVHVLKKALIVRYSTVHSVRNFMLILFSARAILHS